ncbi:MAG: hypothetical protein JXB85_14280 [Anaerolineales bacterium]|nr:hypothetical protein [Anaerolineales bacterium]
MKLRLASALLLVVLMFTVTTSVTAQEYYFRVEQETIHVYWNSDGAVALDYSLAFYNEPGAHVIDFVDIGMPNGNYSSVQADVNGNSVGTSTSDYLGDGSGFAVVMGSHAIQPGQRGTVHVYVGRITGLLYPDDNEPDTYASGEFSPFWFGSQYVSGSTNMTVVFHLPPGMQAEEPRYHPARGGWPCDTAPVIGYDNDGRISYTWACADAHISSQYTFGTSFPRQYVPDGAISSAPSFSLPNFNFDMDGLVGFCFFCCFGLIFLGAPILGVVNERKRKMQYLPPKISIEGHGVKRGLTAVEAGILMGQPLDKVMTMILFGVVKKEAAEVLKREPLELQVAEKLPEDLRTYEKEFLAAFQARDQGARRKDLQKMTVALVQSVSDKMKGFSRKETIAYYTSIMERAWQQIEAADTPEVKSEMYEQALEWTMLDKDYDDRTRRVFTGPVFIPMWWGRYDPTYRDSAAGAAGKLAGAGKISAPGTSVSGGRVSVPGSSFAASVITGVQSVASRTLGDVKTFTSGVTNRTNPIPKTSSSGGKWGGGGGGSSCACACACAGCACACAGGGR